MRLPFSSALVTGGGGFVGSHLVDRLVAEGVSVTVLDTFDGGHLTNLSTHEGSSRLRILKGSVVDADIVKEAVRGAEVVFHEAAMVDVQRSMREPGLAHTVNVEGTRTVLESAVDAGAERFIFASSAAVYGDSPQLPRTEGAPLAPASPYAVSKARAEALVGGAHRKSGMTTTSLRYFNVYGARSESKAYGGVVDAFAKRIARGGTPIIYGDGTQCRDFISVGDVVAANMLAASSSSLPGRCYNVGTGVRTTILELVQAIARILKGFWDQDGVVFKPFREGDVRESVADVSRIRRDLGFVPGVALAPGLRDYLSSTYVQSRPPPTFGDSR